MSLKQRWNRLLQTVSFSEAKARQAEVATRARATGHTWSGMQRLPNPDPVLRKLRRNITAYRDLVADAHVGGCVRRRKAAVTSLAWTLDRGQASARGFKSMQDMLADLDVSAITKEMLDAAFFGYQPLEILPGATRSFHYPKAVVGKPPEWFAFDEENRLRFLAQDAGADGELVDMDRFLLVRQDPSYDNPYGVADLSRCYWPTHFKRGGFDFWIKFLEKFGTPWVVGEYPNGTKDDDIEALLISLEQMVQDAVAAVPNDTSVKIIEAAGKGASGDLHERFLRFCRSEISIALLGQDQTTEANSNRASATAGLEVTADIRDDDAVMVESGWNSLIRRYWDRNFTGPAPIVRMYEDTPGTKDLADRDASLRNAGARFTPVYFKRAYQLQDGDLEEGVPAVPVPAVSFAESTTVPPAPTQLLPALHRSVQPAGEKWIEQIRALMDRILQEGGTVEDFRDQLMMLHADLSLDDYAQAMAEGLGVAFLAGRYDIAQEMTREQ